MGLGLSLDGTCFRRGFCLQVLSPFVHRAQILTPPSITITPALKRTEVLGCGNGAINLNKNRVSYNLLPWNMELLRVLNIWKTHPLLQKTPLRAFHPCYQFLPICLIFSLPGVQGEIWDSFSC